MKRFLMVVLLSALLPLSAFALCVIQDDRGCSPAISAACQDANCSSTTFIADATGMFDLIAKTECPRTGTCQFCESRVCLYETLGSTVIARLSSSDPRCTSCSNIMTVNLRRGVSYTMVVCLGPCGNVGCNDMAVRACHSDCYARGVCKTQNFPCP